MEITKFEWISSLAYILPPTYPKKMIDAGFGKMALKISLLFNLLLVLTGNIFAQDKTALLKQLQGQNKAFNCTFIEEKHIAVLDVTTVSKGIISYDPSVRLTCEYTEPESLKLCKKSDGSLSVTKNGKSVRAGAMYRQMMDMMEGFISGRIWEKTNEYNIDVQSNNMDYIIILTPKSSHHFSLIEIHYDKNKKGIRKTILTEPKGDTTTITMMAEK